jgi:hypothetical protein
MRKQFFIISLTLVSFWCNAQNVGISTNNPQAKLEINHTTTAARPGLLLRDSSSAQAGSIKMQSISSGRYFRLDGSQYGTAEDLGYLDINSDSTSFIATFRSNGNVGIGQYDPAEKLDVTGNINIANGTIKANGVAGQPGQMLMTNNSGQLQWMDKSEYKNFIVFRTPVSNALWPVPPGITKIKIEMWGAGGGGNQYAGGGGGAYVSTTLDVTGVANVDYSVGTGGAGGLVSGAGGSASAVSIPGIFIVAFGGSPANNFGGFEFKGHGGNPSIPANLPNTIAFNGEDGQISTHELSQGVGGIFYETIRGGIGGSAGNSISAGGSEYVKIFNVSTNTAVLGHDMVTTQNNMGSGGGAGFKTIFHSSGSGQSANGYAGSHGRVIIYY